MKQNQSDHRAVHGAQHEARRLRIDRFSRSLSHAAGVAALAAMFRRDATVAALRQSPLTQDELSALIGQLHGTPDEVAGIWSDRSGPAWIKQLRARTGLAGSTDPGDEGRGRDLACAEPPRRGRGLHREPGAAFMQLSFSRLSPRAVQAPSLGQ